MRLSLGFVGFGVLRALGLGLQGLCGLRRVLRVCGFGFNLGVLNPKPLNRRGLNFWGYKVLGACGASQLSLRAVFCC